MHRVCTVGAPERQTGKISKLWKCKHTVGGNSTCLFYCEYATGAWDCATSRPCTFLDRLYDKWELIPWWEVAVYENWRNKTGSSYVRTAQWWSIVSWMSIGRRLDVASTVYTNYASSNRVAVRSDGDCPWCLRSNDPGGWSRWTSLHTTQQRRPDGRTAWRSVWLLRSSLSKPQEPAHLTRITEMRCFI